MITINAGVYRAIQRKKPFEKRPYSFIFIKRSDYHFLDDFVATFKKLGLLYSTVTIYPTSNKQEFMQNLATAITSTNPDFVFTFSHNGVDGQGDLVHFLEDLNIPLVSWILDNPELILRPHKNLTSDNVFIFSTDKTSVQGIQKIGYNNVLYLPLAANIDANDAAYNSNYGKIPSGNVELLFIGDTFLSKIGQFIKLTKSLNPLLGDYKELAKRFVAKHEAMQEEHGAPENAFFSIESLLHPEESAIKRRYLSLSSPETRQRFDLIVLLYANTIYRSHILQETISYNHLIVGPHNWKSILKSPNIKMLPPTYDKKIVDLLHRNASINLNITSVHMNGAANKRIFEVPSGGNFLLTDYSRQLEELFDMDKEVVSYTNKNDFHAKVDKYLHDKNAREKVIMAAKQRIAADHSYDNRAATILNTLKTSRR